MYSHICAWWSYRVSFGRGYGGLGGLQGPHMHTHAHTHTRAHLHTHTHTHTHSRPIDALWLYATSCAAEALSSSPPLLVFLCCCYGFLLRSWGFYCCVTAVPVYPVAARCSLCPPSSPKLFSSFFSSLDLHLRWPQTHFTVPFAQQEREINQTNFFLMRTAFIFPVGHDECFTSLWSAMNCTTYIILSERQFKIFLDKHLQQI